MDFRGWQAFIPRPCRAQIFLSEQQKKIVILYAWKYRQLLSLCPQTSYSVAEEYSNKYDTDELSR